MNIVSVPISVCLLKRSISVYRFRVIAILFYFIYIYIYISQNLYNLLRDLRLLVHILINIWKSNPNNSNTDNNNTFFLE